MIDSDLDSDLLWKNHIDFICHKMSKSIGIIAKLRHYIPRQLLLSIYHTLVTPYLTYGISAWGYCAKTHLNRLLILQKRALRLIFFSGLENMQFPYLSNLIVFQYHLYFSSNYVI